MLRVTINPHPQTPRLHIHLSPSPAPFYQHIPVPPSHSSKQPSCIHYHLQPSTSWITSIAYRKVGWTFPLGSQLPFATGEASGGKRSLKLNSGILGPRRGTSHSVFPKAGFHDHASARAMVDMRGDVDAYWLPWLFCSGPRSQRVGLCPPLETEVARCQVLFWGACADRRGDHD